MSSSSCAGQVAVGLPCSAARDHLSVGPLSCGLGPMWALMPFKTFVPSISFCNSSPNWLHRARHKSVVAILCVECFQVARTLSKSSRHPQDVLFSHFVDGVTGAQRGRMTFPRPHTKGGIQNQASSKISRAGSTPSLQPPPPPQNSDVTSPSIPRVDLFLVLSCFLEDLRDLVGVLSSIQCRWRFLPCLLSQDDVLLVFDSPE